MQIETMPELIRAGCRMAPQATGNIFTHEWDFKTGTRELIGTNFEGAALLATGWYHKLLSFAGVTIKAWDTLHSTWPLLYEKGRDYWCPACGKPFNQFGALFRHCEWTHGLSREDIAEIIEIDLCKKTESQQ